MDGLEQALSVSWCTIYATASSVWLFEIPHLWRSVRYYVCRCLTHLFTISLWNIKTLMCSHAWRYLGRCRHIHLIFILDSLIAILLLLVRRWTLLNHAVVLGDLRTLSSQERWVTWLLMQRLMAETWLQFHLVRRCWRVVLALSYEIRL
jgi:hypothetical protein